MGMYSSVTTAAHYGLHGYVVHVETHIAHGLPRFKIVGLPGKSVEEARDRVVAAIKSSGYTFPLKRITINLSPTNIPKQSSSFDVPIAVSILIAANICIPRDRRITCAFAGELGLDGALKETPGIPILLETLEKQSISPVIIPRSTLLPKGYSLNHDVVQADSLNDIILFLQGKKKLPRARRTVEHVIPRKTRFYDAMTGSEHLKRALLISAAGRHNILLHGPTGCGKTLASQALHELLPLPSQKKYFEIHKIYSLVDHATPKTRPFRNPHHTISRSACIGGGSIPVPGEMTLAHSGILFLDELPEFTPDILQTLRYVLDSRSITFSRRYSTTTFPAYFILAAAMNRCSCGYLGHPVKKCTCTTHQISRYQRKISGTLLDRIDIHHPVRIEKYDTLFSKKNTAPTGTQVRNQVHNVWSRQIQRKCFNTDITVSTSHTLCKQTQTAKLLLHKAYDQLGLSTRGILQVLRVARTIADIEETDRIHDRHVTEALSYRNMDN